ncbi:MAG TPA: ABC transporter permease [Saprospiraceae bacterium]|nr:ABC transporter permease [Saprospiraceae bacterium]
MKNIWFLVVKEFRQTFRDPAILRMIFIMPALQLLILPFAADYEVKNIDIAIVDYDRSAESARLANKLAHSGYFHLIGHARSNAEAMQWVGEDKADIFVEIPLGFAKNWVKMDEASLALVVNAVNGTKGNLGAAYAASIFSEYNDEIRQEWIQMPRISPFPLIRVTNSNRYNRLANYQHFMVPGILAVLLTMVGGFLSALNIVREKEIGTIEQINVSPIRKYEFVAGKLIPFWVMGYVILTIGLVISFLIHGIVPGSNLWVLYLFSGVYLIAILGFGLLISNFTNTQQQAMMIAFFFMLIFILLSGLYTQIESMPPWAQTLAWINPVTYMVDAMRMILLKGAVLSDLTLHFKNIFIGGLVLNALAIWSYRKRS